MNSLTHFIELSSIRIPSIKTVSRQTVVWVTLFSLILWSLGLPLGTLLAPHEAQALSPIVWDVYFMSPTKVIVKFDQTMDPSTIQVGDFTIITNYTETPADNPAPTAVAMQNLDSGTNNGVLITAANSVIAPSFSDKVIVATGAGAPANSGAETNIDNFGFGVMMSPLPPNVLMSEVQLTGSSASDEAIELYNKTSLAVDISSWILKSISSIGVETTIKTFDASTSVAGSSFFSICHVDFDSVPTNAVTDCDATYGTASDGGLLDNNESVILYDSSSRPRDLVGWGTAVVYEGSVSSANPGAHGSLERKATPSSTQTQMRGDHIGWGNAYDTNNNQFDLLSHDGTTTAAQIQSSQDGTETEFGGGGPGGGYSSGIPGIDHWPVFEAATGNILKIFARMWDPETPNTNLTAQLKYIKANDVWSNISTVDGTHIGSGFFKFQIPAADVTANDINYYLKVTDSDSNAVCLSNSGGPSTCAPETGHQTNAFLTTGLDGSGWTGTISGTVRDGSQAGTPGIANANLIIQGTGFSALSASDGTFTLSGLPTAGVYQIVIVASGFMEGWLDGVNVGSSNNIVDLWSGSGGGGGGDMSMGGVMWTAPGDGSMGAPRNISAIGSEAPAPILIAFTEPMDSTTLDGSTTAVTSGISTPKTVTDPDAVGVNVKLYKFDPATNAKVTPLGASPKIASYKVVYDQGCQPGVDTAGTTCGVPGLAMDFGPDPKVIIYDPDSDPATLLEENTPYLVELTPAVKTINGNALQGNRPGGGHSLFFMASGTGGFTMTSGNFGTGGFFTPPFMENTSPSPGAFGVPPNTKILLSFSEPMDSASITSTNIKLYRVTSPFTASETLTEVSATLLLDIATKKLVTITPSTPLTQGNYRVKVLGAVRSESGITIGPPGSETQDFFRLDFDSSGTADTTGPSVNGTSLQIYGTTTITNVPTSHVIEIGMSEALDPSTVNTQTVTLAAGTSSVTTKVEYDSWGHGIWVTPTSATQANTTYTLTLTTGVKDLSGNALASAYTQQFTTGAVDTTAPRVEYVGGDDFSIAVTFTEPMNAANISDANKWGSSVLNPLNYKLYYYTTGGGQTIHTGNNCSAGCDTLAEAQGLSFTFEAFHKTVIIEGFSGIGSNVEFRIYVDNVKDLSGNVVADSGNSTDPSLGNGAGGTTQSSATTFGNIGPGGGGMIDPSKMMGPTGFGTYDPGNMAFMPVGVFPMNSTAGRLTTYFVDVPVSTQLQNSDIITLTFPQGFDVTNATKDAFSPMNNDFNQFNAGTITFDTGYGGGDGVLPDVIARTVKIKLSITGTPPVTDFLHFDLDKIKNSTIPKDYNTSGYTVDIKIDRSGTILESKTSMPFFVTEAGSYKITGTLTAPVNILDGQEVRLVIMSPFGPVPPDSSVTFSGGTTATYTFSNLNTGWYNVMFEPTITLTRAAGGSIDLLSPMSNGIQLPDVGNASYNDSTKTYTSNVTLADVTVGRLAFTVNITGAFGTDDVDIFASSYNGWNVKTLTDAGTNPSANVYLSNGTWWVGIGPAMPKTFGPMSGPPPMPSWMPPQPREVVVSGCPLDCSASPASPLAFAITTFDEQVIGYVQDGAGNGLADVQVFGHQTMGNFGMPSNTTTDTTGKFTLKTTIGLFALGAWKQGLPPSPEISVEVKNENAVTGGNADGNTLSDVLRNGTLVTATNKLILKLQKTDYTITGYVYDSTDATAAVVPYAPVWAQNPATGEMAPSGTDERGKYTLFVTGSPTGVTWKVQGHIPGLGDIAPVSVVVQDTSNICSTKQCQKDLRPSVSQADMAIISGRVYASSDTTYTAGEELTDAHIWIEGQDSSGNFYGNGSSADSQGKYSMKVPAGTNYKIHAWTALYGEQPEIVLGIVTTATTYANKDFRIDSGNIRTITPAFTNAISGLEGFVDAFKPSTGSGFHIRVADIGSVASGERLKLADGTYEIRAYVPGFGDIAATSNPITIEGDATVTFVLPAAGSLVTLSGTVCIDGNADSACGDGSDTNITSGAFVWLDKLSGVGGDFGGNHYGIKADGSGAYSVILEEGTYMLGVDVPSYSSLAPLEVTYANTTDPTPTKDFVVTLNTDTISGSVYVDATTKATKGWVWAERVTSATDLATHASGGWAGGPIENGDYQLSVGDGFWRVFAVSEGYQKAFTNFGTCVGSTDSCSPTSPTGVNLTLTALANYTPPVPKITKITPATGGVVDDTANSGVKIIIQPNSISNTTISNSTELQVIMKENTAVIENKSQKSATGTTTEISVVDPSSGTEIKNFNPAISIEYHYNESDIPVGMLESELSFQEIDPITGQYAAVPSVVDTTNNIIRATTNTLSAFATGGSAGASPPATPATPTMTQSGSSVTVSWAANTEPAVVGYEVYRSTSATGTFPNISGDSTAGGVFNASVLAQGSCVGAGLTCTYSDSPGQTGTYYYKIRAFVSGSVYSASSAAGSGNYTAPLGGSPAPSPAPAAEEEEEAVEPEEEVTPEEETAPGEEIIAPAPTAYADGTLIRATGSPDIYVVREGKKLHIPSWDAFVAAGYSLSDVQEVSASDVAVTKSAALFRVDGDDKVYVIKGRNTLHIPSPEALAAWGYEWSDVAVVPVKDASGFKKITLGRVEGDDKVYVLGSGVKRHIPNPDVFNTSGYDWAEIIEVTPVELAEYAQSGLVRGAGQVKVYLVEETSKRWVKTAEVFEARGYNWAHIQEVSGTELAAYLTGSDITE